MTYTTSVPCPVPLPTDWAEFMKQLNAELVEALARQHGIPEHVIGHPFDAMAGTTTFTPDRFADPLIKSAVEVEAMRRWMRELIMNRARMAAPLPMSVNFPDSGLTNQGKSVSVPVSQAGTHPPGTIGEPDVSTLHGLAQHTATTVSDDAGNLISPARLTVGAYLLSLFRHAEDAFAIRVGRKVQALPRFNHLARIPPGVYEVVKHHRVDGVAYVSLRATKPKVPGGKIDPHVFTRVAINDVNPVPCWDVFPAAVFGPTADILPGLAARGFGAAEMALLADHWQDSGFTFAPKDTMGLSLFTITASDFAAAWLEFFTSDAVKSVPPVHWEASFNVNRANHHPK